MPVDDPIFIFGSARSGTTLLRVLLGGHPRLAALDELNFETMVVRAYQQLLADAPILARLPGFELERTRHLLLASHRGPRDAICAALGKARWVDNTHTTNDRMVQMIDELYDGQCAYLLVRRHPGDIVASRLERWRDQDPLACSREIEAIAAAQQQMLDQIPERTHEVRYECLVREPDEVMRSVFDFLGESTIGYAAARALQCGARRITVGDDKIRRRPTFDEGSIGRWRSALPPDVVAALETDRSFIASMRAWSY